MRLLCRNCIESFRSAEDAEAHVQAAHPDQAAKKAFYWALCPECDGRFGSVDELQSHRDESGH